MPFDQIFGDAELLIRTHGPAGVGVVLFFESFGAPLPGESLLILSAVLAARGELSITGLLLWAWAGSVAGDNVGYLIGRTLGRVLITGYGGRIGLTAERFERIEAVFSRWGPIAVAFARFFDVLRQLNGIVAGTAGMDWKRFLLFNALGAALWVGTWGLGAFFLGRHVSSFTAFARHVGPWGIAALAAAVASAVAVVVILARRIRPAK